VTSKSFLNRKMQLAFGSAMIRTDSRPGLILFSFVLCLSSDGNLRKPRIVSQFETVACQDLRAPFSQPDEPLGMYDE
jgi:hypothetical protein